MRYLSQAELVEINQYIVQQVGGITFGVQSKAALQVIVNQLQQIVFGHELYPTIWLKVAFILQKIAKKHVFIDGNKRTAIQAALYFLMINGHQVKDDRVINDADQFVLSVTNSPDNEDTMLMIAKWFAISPTLHPTPTSVTVTLTYLIAATISVAVMLLAGTPLGENAWLSVPFLRFPGVHRLPGKGYEL